MNPSLVPFDLERWLRAQWPQARFAIGGSGRAVGDLAPFLPASREEGATMWATPADAAHRGVMAAVAQAYHVEAEDVVLTQGASEADFLAALALGGPGGHVVVESPAYHALLQPARALGCRVTRVDRGPDEGFALDPGAVLEALTPETDLVVLCRPHNPSGDAPPEAVLAEIADAAEEVGAWVLVDEVFADATPGLRPSRLVHDRIVSTNSLTKCLGFGPLHVGWLLAGQPARESLERAKAVVSVTNPVMDLVLGARVLAERDALLKDTRVLREANLPVVAATMKEAGLTWHAPNAGTTVVVQLPPRHAKDTDFARDLLADEGVLVGPGSFMELRGWVRLGLLTPTEELRAGLEGFTRAATAAEPAAG